MKWWLIIPAAWIVLIAVLAPLMVRWLRASRIAAEEQGGTWHAQQGTDEGSMPDGSPRGPAGQDRSDEDEGTVS